MSPSNGGPEFSKPLPERLRERAERYADEKMEPTADGFQYVIPGESPLTAMLLTEAADEIERLREAIIDCFPKLTMTAAADPTVITGYLIDPDEWDALQKAAGQG